MVRAEIQAPKGYNWEAPSSAFERWAEIDLAPQASSENTIDIYDVIGEDFWSGGGFTEKKLAGILRTIGNSDVTVNINSPGGDMFAGLAIYNRLKAHKGKVSVNIYGVAASAASLIAMAGADVKMGTGAMLMIHRAWGMVIGNTTDFADAAKTFDQFDASMADIYAERTGIAAAEILPMLDAETWLGADEAVSRGFADGKIADEEQKSTLPANILSRRRIEAALKAQGYSRKEANKLISAGLRDATEENGERDAASTEVLASLQRLTENFHKGATR